MSNNIKTLQGSSSSTQTIEISVLKKEDGVPIYQTNENPITYSSNWSTKNPIKKEFVKGVDGAYILRNVLSPDECDQFVQITEKMGYEDATVTTFGGMRLMKDVRDNKRVMWQSQSEVWIPIWERVKSFLDNDLDVHGKHWEAHSLNERLRFYKYEPGQIFQKHYDGCFPRSSHEISYATFIIYLTDGFDGGHTTFYTGKTPVKVNPVKGSALVFFHGYHEDSPLHEGSACAKGLKYVLRSDVMYIDDYYKSKKPTKQESNNNNVNKNPTYEEAKKQLQEDLT